VDRLTYILDIFPASGNKSMPVGLMAATVLATEDPQCAVVAQASFWRLGGRSSQWSMAALRLCSLCAAAEATDPIRMFPFSPFSIRFTVLVLA
jgi:hypothetical protein